jgi:hypothetical protein
LVTYGRFSVVWATREGDKEKMRTKAYLNKVSAAMVAAMAAAFVTLLVAPVGAVNDLKPDLRMAPFDMYTAPYIERTPDGRRLLHFDSIIVNVGAGAFEVHGSRPSTNTPELTVTQSVFNDAGTAPRSRSTAARMYYSGDGHDHWHVRNLQKYTLSRLADGKKVRTGDKHGFCFWDNVWFGSSQGAFYTDGSTPRACGQFATDEVVVMGLSRGWGDIYPTSWVPDQYIDITGVTRGKYRLKGVVDPSGWFLEEDNTNNFTWLDIKIQGNTVIVTRHGPAAQPLGAGDE